MNTQTNPKYTRAQYMSNEVSHADYYGQFVTPGIKSMVADKIGINLLLRSTDEHLNDIPLPIWDGLAGSTKLQRMHGDYSCTLRVADDNSLASQVCVLKQAARQIIAESKVQP